MTYDYRFGKYCRHQDYGVFRFALHSAYPICLPPPDVDHRGQEADLAGWGLSEYTGSVPGALQQVRLQAVDPLCANVRDVTFGKACSGGRGDPLLVQGADDLYQVIEFPGIYAKVFKCNPCIVDNSRWQ
ncbi:serine protease filzig-like [Pollicipes pollicipes]|uniref:serine protease filzig-like n=1 Tax=Pollicipes pollicipes TaxID=41117 RepID=UPI0018851DEF|nr:serine protease filzig-like [Pollicipes pollicipes]XP_037091164.1 serine protease filzig-like [Pollicipes pollicipes]